MEKLEWDKDGVIDNILSPVEIPRMVRVRQKFDTKKLESVEQTVDEEICRLSCSKKITPGMRIAVAVGSRGIANIDCIARQTVD